MHIDVRTVETAGIVEIYITAVPTPKASIKDQAHEVFCAVKDTLLSTGAKLLQERIFASKDAMAEISSIRSETYGDLDDGAPCAWLLAPETPSGEVAGVQVHAIKCCEPICQLSLKGAAVGRALKVGDIQHVTVSGLTPSDSSSLESCAQSLLDDAEAILKSAGVEFSAITRTWFWLGDISAWYNEFNIVRNKFFSQRGMIRSKADDDMPASTGIGVFPMGGAPCALDFVSVTGPTRLSRNLASAGHQDSALKYGSAFSRATQAKTPAGETVYVSGTAAIDMKGDTVCIGDAEAQIRDTIKNVRGVLSDTNCADSDVVHALAYCKTPEIEQVWQSIRDEMPWPFVTIIADICRENLLFEVEATAVRGASKII
ncbi:MAG: Rid family hydrolase [Armatimonadetes bacterium]|nr:Rid family hydrolase [Armatimonadota bacterium]